MLQKSSPKGNYGETVAIEYLKKNGYSIIERNWRSRPYEVDVVAIDNGVLVIVEVKTQFNATDMSPEEEMTPWKIRTISQAAQLYSHLHPDLPEQLRIDFVGVRIVDSSEPQINLIKNITG